MTYKEMKKTIKMLEEAKGHMTTGYALREKTETLGHGVFRGTGEFEIVPTYGTNGQIELAIAKIKRTKTYKDGERAEMAKKAEKAKKAKVERYKKELAEMEARREYIEKWLAENDI